MLYSRLNTKRGYGSGTGVTWNCALDTDISNSSSDCPRGWDGGNQAIDPKTATGALITNGMKGEVTWDVTQDIINMLDSGEKKIGFLIKIGNERMRGTVNFYSKESAKKEEVPGLGPRLVLVFKSKSDLCYSGLYNGLSLDSSQIIYPDERDTSLLPLCSPMESRYYREGAINVAAASLQPTSGTIR